MKRYLILILAFCLPISFLFADVPYLGYSDYQIVTDPTFDASSYFQEMESHGVNLQRIWTSGYNNSIPHVRELMPFEKLGGKYNLDRIDPDYLIRLRSVISSARTHNQKVLLTLFDHWALSTEEIFPQSPWFYKNNRNGILKKALPDFYNLRKKNLVAIQKNYVRTIVSRTREFDPIYEIMNEANWSADCAVLDSWQRRVASWILAEDPDAEIAINIQGHCTGILQDPWVDVISFHAGVWEGNGICNTVQKYIKTGKTIVIDTDGAWETRDENRRVTQWLRESLRCGASFNHKDNIYKPDLQLLREYRIQSERLDTK